MSKYNQYNKFNNKINKQESTFKILPKIRKNNKMSQKKLLINKQAKNKCMNK